MAVVDIFHLTSSVFAYVLAASLLAAAADSTCETVGHEDEFVSLMQLSRPEPVLRHRMDHIELHEEELELDEHPLENYNFGVTWNDWYDDMVQRFPPSGTGYETTNYGLASETLHHCAASVPAGEIGHSWAFNHTAGTNMYATLASKSPTSLSNARVLEVSSGRGGGAALLSDCFCPAEMVGMDLSTKQVASSESRYGRNGSCPIHFMQGDAMKLPFSDKSFDVIVNVEASHTYPSYRTFLREVWRVLRPKGAFLTVDFRSLDDADLDVMIMQQVFGMPVFPIDISHMVLRSFHENKLIEPFKAACMSAYQQHAQLASWKSLNYSLHCDHFAGTGFTEPALRGRKWNYRMYILQKSEADHDAASQ